MSGSHKQLDTYKAPCYSSHGIETCEAPTGREVTDMHTLTCATRCGRTAVYVTNHETESSVFML